MDATVLLSERTGTNNCFISYWITVDSVALTKKKKMQVFSKLWGFHDVKDIRVPALGEL